MLPLLLEYNQRCVPPWTEDKLRYRSDLALEKANENPSKRGSLLAKASGQVTQVHAGGPVFPANVPDFIMFDKDKFKDWWFGKHVRYRRRGRAWMFHGLLWWICMAVILQKNREVHLADVLLASKAWGSRDSWPRNWRRQAGFAGTLHGHGTYVVTNRFNGMTSNRECSPNCLLWGHVNLPHRHHVGIKNPAHKQAD